MSRQNRIALLATVFAIFAASGMLLMRSQSWAQDTNPPTRLEWKPVGDNGVPFKTYRAAIPGGWLVTVHQKSERHRNYREGTGFGMGVGAGVTFVPDPEHRWR